jgi:predicted GIY-YIG superfamily endonuclease
MLYLLHFDRPYHHARHYTGCTHNLERRLTEHRKGTGAKLLRAVNRAGIGYEVVRTWQGYRDEELQLKAQKNAPRYCPVCLQEQVRTRLGLHDVALHDLLSVSVPVSLPTPEIRQEVLL